MKKLLSLPLMIIAFAFSASAQYVTIPDIGFRNFLKGKFPTCFNASDMMDTSNALIVNATTLEIAGYTQVDDWNGFQYFKNLQKAGFSEVYITSLPTTLPSTLKELIIDPPSSNMSTYTSLPALPSGLTKLVWHFGGDVTSLPVLPSSLLYLDIWYAETLSSVPALPNTLTHLALWNCFVIQPLSSFPTSLTYLNYSASNQSITSVPSLPNSIDTFECASNAITSLPALPASLKRFRCYNNHITALPALPATLEYIDCSANALTSLPALPVSLRFLNCSSNQLTGMPALPSLVHYLDASNNHQLTTLPAFPAVLDTLVAQNCYLNALPALPATLLSINVYSNRILTLPILPSGLIELECSYNKLSTLPVLPGNLSRLFCSGNHLHALPTLPQSLTIFQCSSNSISSISYLPPNITNFDCSHNNFTSLPALPSHLTEFYCNNNQLFTLPDLPASLWRVYCHFNNLTCLPVLPGTNNADLIFDDKIACTPNAVPHAGIRLMHANTTFTSYNYMTPYPVCSVINNSGHCDAYPLMTGYVYYDNNNNNIWDTDEPARANVKVKLSNGSFTFTNNNGFYAIAAVALGNYSTSIDAPVHFASVPLQYNYTFTTYDTLVTRNFGCQPTETIDSVDISITPYFNAATVGGEYAYVIDYQNAGTTTLSPNIVFNYDNTRLTYVSCDNIAVNNTGNSLTLSETNLVPGTQNSFIGYFTVSTTAVLGDSLRSYAHISANAVAADDSNVVSIRAPFDPNDKSATPVLTPTQVINGGYIYYIIRFQNTGNDTAFSVVVTDTLSSNLRPSTLEMLGTSHPCKTTVIGKNVSFEFINIMLPDSNVNQLKSHGYISFRIKPINTLVANNVVPNKAAIYFDYNSPVITNTALTTILEPIVVPLKLLSFTASKGIGSTANLYWQTTNEMNVKNYEIEMSTNGRVFTNIGSENAKGNQYNNYTRSIAIPSNAILYFRLKMTDLDGLFSYSDIAILRNDKVNNTFSFLSNPVKDELSIALYDENLKNTTAKIFNAQGGLVKTILLQNDVENINVKSLPAGTYSLVTVKGNRQFVIIK